MRVTGVKYLLMAQDMDRAVEFWTGVFALAKRSGDEHWTELVFGDAVVALHGGHDGSFNATGLSLDVDDIEAAAAAVKEAGGRVPGPPRREEDEPLMLAECVDTEGNGFMLAQQLAG